METHELFCARLFFPLYSLVLDPIFRSCDGLLEEHNKEKRQFRVIFHRDLKDDQESFPDWKGEKL